MNIKYKIKTFTQKKLDKYRFKMQPWLKRFLLKYELLERKNEILQRKKIISKFLYESNVSKADMFYEVFTQMADEMYKSIQYASYFNYLPIIGTVQLGELARQDDLGDPFFLVVELRYSPYGFIGLNDIKKLLENFDKEIASMIKKKL